MADIREVARRAGVSIGTVSNVLNHPEHVAEKLRERVLQAIEELGYVRNHSASQLRAGHSISLGLVVPDITNPFFSEVVRGVEDVARESGYLLILCSTKNSPELENQYLKLLEEQRVLGILITPVQSGIGFMQRIRQHGIALVLLDRASRSQDVCSVTVDDVLGGELAAQHLLAHNHRRIGFIHGTLATQFEPRWRGFRRELLNQGLEPAQIVTEFVVPEQNAEEGERIVEQILRASPLPTALFCANDILAVGCMRGLFKAGVAIPEDIALVGFDDLDFVSMLSIPLTSIRQPKYLLGRKAAELLIAETSETQAHVHQHIVYQPDLMVRESSTEIREGLIDAANKKMDGPAKELPRGRRLVVQPHLSLEELEQRAAQTADATEREHAQILLLLTQGLPTQQVAQQTGYSVHWVRALVRRYNQSGLEALGDHRRANQGAIALLTEAQQQELAQVLRHPPDHGKRWTGPLVAQWISQRLGRTVHPQRGWEYLKRLRSPVSEEGTQKSERAEA